MTNPLTDMEKEMHRILSTKGNSPPLIILGGPRTDGIEPGVYVLQTDNTYLYYTFQEWEERER